MSQHELIIVGGPNGAGKSTFAYEELARTGGMYLSADAIAAELLPSNPSAAAIQAGRVFIERFEQALSTQSQLIIESTLSGKTPVKWIQRAKSCGYQVRIVFVYVDSVETSLVRIRQRALSGGHDVPEADVRRRFGRSISNFWNTYREMAHGWLLIYNGESGPTQVATGTADSVSRMLHDHMVRFLQLQALRLPK